MIIAGLIGPIQCLCRNVAYYGAVVQNNGPTTYISAAGLCDSRLSRRFNHEKPSTRMTRGPIPFDAFLINSL